MKRTIGMLILSVLLLSSCTSTARHPQPIELSVKSLVEGHSIRLSLTQAQMAANGWQLGDWALVELDGTLFKVRIADRPLADTVTLVVSYDHADLYLPANLKRTSKGILIPYREKHKTSSSVSLSGTFVFTL